MSHTDKLPLKILLVDDSEHDRYFFQQVLNDIPFPTLLSTIDGLGFSNYLTNNSDRPDVLFLDLNMPGKNGFDCLAELKSDEELRHIPVVIYSSAFDEIVADELYKNGAHFYVQKKDFADLTKVLHVVLSIVKEKNINRPSRNEFAFKLKTPLNSKKQNPYEFY